MHVIKRKIVKQDTFGAGRDCLAKFVQRLNLDFDKHTGVELLCRFDGGANAAGTFYMVFLDKYGVIETDSMILAAATGNGIFLCQP